MHIRNNLKLLRNNRGFSLRQLGSETGIPFSYLWQMEHGQRVPSDQELENICKVLRCTDDMIYPSDKVRAALDE